MKKKLGLTLFAGGALAVGSVLLAAPRSQDVAAPESLEELAQQALASGKTGRELADAALVCVAQAFPYYSLWHLWQAPEQSLKAHRGWSHQYNTVLLLVLRELGFEARLVHAARVRGFGHPWWLAGHTWVKVTIDGRTYDACASRTTNRLGECGFVALTPELPLRVVTRWSVGVALVPFVVKEVWAAWLTKRPIRPWIYGPKPGRYHSVDGEASLRAR